MVIYFKEQEQIKIRRFYIPRCCISLGASIITRVLSSTGVGYLKSEEISKEVKALSKAQAKEIREMLKYLNKNYKGLTIVDIETKNEVIKITI